MSRESAIQWIITTVASVQNDTISMDNSTMMNTTLAFVQEDDTVILELKVTNNNIISLPNNSLK